MDVFSLQDQEENYKLLLEILQVVVSSLKERVELKQVYNNAIKVIAAKKPQLQQNFTKTCGFGVRQSL